MHPGLPDLVRRRPITAAAAALVISLCWVALRHMVSVADLALVAVPCLAVAAAAFAHSRETGGRRLQAQLSLLELVAVVWFCALILSMSGRHLFSVI